MITVFLVDDHEIVRQGIATLIGTQSDMEVIGEAESASRALVRIAARPPEVAVLDVRLPDGSGVSLCRDIRSSWPAVRCLMLTAFDDDDAAYASMLAGASGYVTKDIRGQGLLDGIRRVAAGHRLGDPRVTRRMVDASREQSSGRSEDPRFVSLTARERSVLDLIAEGMSNRQIGDRLDIAEKTVKNHVSGLLRKLGIERRTQAAVLGMSRRDGR